MAMWNFPYNRELVIATILMLAIAIKKRFMSSDISDKDQQFKHTFIRVSTYGINFIMGKKNIGR